MYAVYNCSEDEVGHEGTFSRWEAEEAAKRLNHQPPQP